jgi:hypothetical protein
MTNTNKIHSNYKVKYKTTDSDFSSTPLLTVIQKKIIFFKDIVQKTVLHINKNKLLNILAIGDVNICIEKLNELNNVIKTLSISILDKNINTEIIINELQKINNELSFLFKNYEIERMQNFLKTLESSIC